MLRIAIAALIAIGLIFAARGLWEQWQAGSIVTRDPALIAEGEETDPEAYDAAVAAGVKGRQGLAALFQEYDLLLTPAAADEAPVGLGGTGDPLFNRAWTLLGLPCLSIPGLVGNNGLPVGVQAVGSGGNDAAILRQGAWLAALLARE